VTLSTAVEGTSIVMMVEDTGVGIAADDLARVGDPFFQARGSYARPYDGTGLGLSIVKGLVALHGGDIDIHSRIGEGTRITVRLPIDCEAARREAKRKAQPVSEWPMARTNTDHQMRKRA
jgi:two-component system, cell cycle sensor histidine kinase DivJ